MTSGNQDIVRDAGDEAAPKDRALADLAERKFVGEISLVRPILAGFAAWLVTLGPALTSAKATFPCEALGLVSLAALVAAYFAERRGLRRVMQVLLFWIFPIGAALALAVVGHVPGRPDLAAGFLGSIAWGFFAYAGSSTVFSASADRAVAQDRKEKKWSRELWFLLAVAICAVALQAIGWTYITAERALLVRVCAAGSGIVIVSAAAHYLLNRETARELSSPKTRARAIVQVSLTLLFVICAATAFFLIR